MQEVVVTTRSVAAATAALCALATAAGLGVGGASVPTAAAGAAPASSGSGALTPELPRAVLRASAAPGGTWRPEPARYGTVSTDNVGVRMHDGTVLRVNVIRPASAKTGKPAHGTFPVLL